MHRPFYWSCLLSLVGPTTSEPIAIDGTLNNSTVGSIERLHLVGSDTFRPAFQASLAVISSTLRLENSLFEGAGAQDAFYISSFTGASITLDHLTVVGHVVAGIGGSQSSGSTFVIANSIAFGNGTNVELDGTVDLRPENLIGVDPLFTDADGGDFSLSEFSPAVDAGDSGLPGLGPYDLAHGGRIVGPETDLGAFERGALFSDGFETGSPGAWGW